MTRIKRDAIRHLYSVADAQHLDRVAVEERGIPGILLMKRAGRAALDALQEKWPAARHLEIFCGSGNNAGDGYILAGLTADKDFGVCVWELAQPDKLRGDAALARQFAGRAGVQFRSFEDYQPSAQSQVLVDALLGTGFKGDLRGPYKAAIDAINTRNLPVLALDLPSGLQADTGHIPETAVRADLTLSFIVMKKGLMTGQAADYVGELQLDDLGLGQELVNSVSPSADLLGDDDLQPVLQRRRRTAHKGDFGTLLVIGGDLGFGGATIMAAETALSAGVGRVVLATHSAHVAAALARCPEIMARAIEHPAQQLPALLENATALVVGPGLGQSVWSQQMLYLALQSPRPKVLDADALNGLAAIPQWREYLNSECLLTPHPGEAGRLLGKSAQEVQKDRFAALVALQKTYPGSIVLKGLGTLVASRGLPVGLCAPGNPGMASAGMGDVLSGLAGALLARGMPSYQVARAAVLLHAIAADRQAEESGEIGLKATDLLGSLRQLMNREVSGE